MKTIQIDIPEELARRISESGADQRGFVLEAILEKLNKRKDLNAQLKEGYQATYEEDLHLSDDFKSADFSS